MSLEIIPRSAWATARPNFSASRKGQPDAFLHHVGGGKTGVLSVEQEKALLRSIEADVMRRGYIAIDYDIMLFQSGRAYEGRGFANEDAATSGNNATSQSYCAVGNFHFLEVPTPALLNVIPLAVARGTELRWTVPDVNLRPHNAVYATACPGSNLLNYMGQLREQTRALITGTAPAAPPKRKDDPMVGFFWRDPSTGGIYYCDFSSNTWLNQDALAAYTWILATKGATPKELETPNINDADFRRYLLSLPGKKAS